MATVLIATSNAGKLRDFAAAAAEHGISVAGLPNFSSLPQVAEDQPTFEANARKKAEAYSRFAAGAIVLADDSGLEVKALDGAPGVRSARYAAISTEENASDAANNGRLLAELRTVPEDQRQGQFVCVIVAAHDGKILATFAARRGEQFCLHPEAQADSATIRSFIFPRWGRRSRNCQQRTRRASATAVRRFENFWSGWKSSSQESGSGVRSQYPVVSILDTAAPRKR